ncbi:Tetratricopeptide-like helical domain superfamily [Sesbania bispinosa]|nr:Tetratricopeptide-like helical domain superfamily [Sesbania bispinosa]
MAAEMQSTGMLTREQLIHLFDRFDFLTSQPDVKKRIADAVQDKQRLNIRFKLDSLSSLKPDFVIHVQNGKVDIARQLYAKMLETDDGAGAVVDNYNTFIAVKGLCNLGNVEEGRRLIKYRWGKGCVPHVVFYNVIIDGYCRKGDLKGASRVLKELKLKGFLPTLETYEALVNGFCKAGEFKAVDQLLIEMAERGLNVNVQVFNNIIDCEYKHGLVTKAAETMRRMAEMGCEPDITTYNTLINFSRRGGRITEAEELIERAKERGLLPNKITYTPLMHAYCKQGDYEKLHDLNSALKTEIQAKCGHLHLLDQWILQEGRYEQSRKSFQRDAIFQFGA